MATVELHDYDRISSANKKQRDSLLQDSQLLSPTQTQVNVSNKTKPIDMRVVGAMDYSKNTAKIDENSNLPVIDWVPNASSIECNKKTPISSKGCANKNRLVLMSVEIFAMSRNNLTPNPKNSLDAIRVISYSVTETIYSPDSEIKESYSGSISLADANSMTKRNIRNAILCSEVPVMKDSAIIDRLPLDLKKTPKAVHLLLATERDVILSLVSIVRTIDPDFIIGYDVQRGSLGWLIERAAAVHPPIDLVQELSRMPCEPKSRRNEYDEYSEEHESGIFITGRIIINVWKRMRSELKLSRYTVQAVTEHVLKERLPFFSSEQLTAWFNSPKLAHRVYRYLHMLSNTNISLMENLDIIRRTSESAALIGIDFFSVMTRGSQYTVESIMLHVAHKYGYIAPSPTKEMVAKQAAMEVIPLVMEPLSRFYVDPVVVLDFQSLYPSMMCAYNLCFSTIMGKFKPGTGVTASDGGCETTGRIGTYHYSEASTIAAIARHLRADTLKLLQQSDTPPDILEELIQKERRLGSMHSQDASCMFEKRPFIAPNGAVFCSPEIRKGILPLMLQEILDTRQMIKRAMKIHKKNAVLQRVLEARQLALKLIANVTYGYTAAGFSGRMPMAELADAIVQCGRSTLEWAIELIHTNSDWKARVVYGDTDSLFIHLPGRTKSAAFAIGRAISDEITGLSPKGVVLKFEKVYLPCILLSKKRYVGYMYEDEKQLEGHLDAKGIEMVRRDQCPATCKMQEKILRILFTSKDVTSVKAYVLEQFRKMHEGLDKIPLKEFIFSKEVRLGHYATDSKGVAKALPPCAIVAHKAMLHDPLNRPPYRWRVAYVVCACEPGSRLRDMIVTPEEVVQSNGLLRINHLYYINKCIIPSLHRLLCLVGVDIEAWYRAMPKPPSRLRKNTQLGTGGFVFGGQKQTTITSFMRTELCDICRAPSKKRICDKCITEIPDVVIMTEISKFREIEEAAFKLQMVCKNCAKHNQNIVLPTGFESGMQKISQNSAISVVELDNCQSLDCSVFYERHRIRGKHEDMKAIMDEISNIT
jgi:DNA polymerase zeta